MKMINNLLKILLLILSPLMTAVDSYGQSNKKISTQKSTCNQVQYLQNSSASFGINLFGGAITDFHLKDNTINPFTWTVNNSDMPLNNRRGANFTGHFLCLGRWGSPTEGEIEAGVPHNGQSGNTCWQLKKPASSLQMKMQSSAPMDGIHVKRTIVMDALSPVVKVTEQVQSTTTISRLFNMVQHATIGPPFLDTSVVIDCNAGKGFLQSMSYPDPQRFQFEWPNGLADSAGAALDLQSSATPFSYVATHIFNDRIGWITATNASRNLLVGYIWKTAEYPFVNVWQQWKDNRLWAKGLEFGTTGVGKSYQDLLEVDTRFNGIPSFFLLDAKQQFQKSYCCFLLKIPAGFRGVQSVKLFDGKIAIIEKGNESLMIIPTSLTL